MLSLLFAPAGTVAYIAATTFLRKYFLFSQARSHTVQEALDMGEDERIEFKRSISFDSAGSVEQILQTVAAFANSGDGTIFIGIEDDGHIKGMAAAGSRERDQLSQRSYQLVRQRIKPTPSIRVDFADMRGYTVCSVFVPRGEEPLHFLDWVIYLRYGSADIKAPSGFYNAGGWGPAIIANFPPLFWFLAVGIVLIRKGRTQVPRTLSASAGG